MRAAIKSKPKPKRNTRASNRARPARDRLVKTRENDVVERFDKLSGGVLLTEREVALITGHTVNSLKYWRQHNTGKGPPAMKMPGLDCIRYSVAGLRTWLEGFAKQAPET